MALKRTTLIFGSILTLAMLAPFAFAVHGTPPTAGCLIVQSPQAGEASRTISNPIGSNYRAMAIGPDNSVYLLVTVVRNVAPTTTITYLFRYNTSCSLMASADPACEGGDGSDENGESFRFQTVRLDKGGRIVAGFHCTTDGSTRVHIATFYASNLTRIKRSADLATLVPAATYVQDVESIGVGTDDLDYIALVGVSGGQRYLRMDRKLTTVDYYVVGQATADLIQLDDAGLTNFFVGYSSGAAGLADKVTASTGVSAATVTITSSRLVSIDKNPPITTYGAADTAYVGLGKGTAGSTEMGRRNITISTWVSADTDTYSPAQVAFNDPGPHVTLRDTDAYWWDLDGADNVLMCGDIPAGPVPWFAHLKPTIEHQFWNVTSLSPLSSTIANVCNVDYAGNVWVGYDSTTTTYLRYYTNTGFTGISQRGGVTVPLDEGGPAMPTPGTLFNVDGNTIPGVGAFGANLFFGVLMIAGMTVSMGASPMAFASDRSFRFSTALAVIGAVLGFFMAWAFGFLSTSAVFVVVILAIVIIGFYVVRRSG